MTATLAARYCRGHAATTNGRSHSPAVRTRTSTTIRGIRPSIYRSQTYNNLYKGIREASYFMQHVYECPEIGDTDKGYMYNEARFLRAYYYSLLMSTFGPVFILGDEPADFTQEDLNERERDSWEKCVDYVTTELYEASKGLPDAGVGVG
ncbi:MAG: RagB/SusD family nutrient uptake outer membrane protein [Alistipes communis]